MANEKILNSRIRLKYDSYTEWQEKNPTLLEGEVAIAYLSFTHTNTIPDNGTHPILLKVGPGTFNSLPWASALAADVYTWAKKETPDWSDFPALPIVVADNESGKFITDIKYSKNNITISRSDIDWADVKNADKGISAEQTKAYIAKEGDTSEEVWIFYCGTSEILV